MDEPIKLTWGQQLAASWAITWPALLMPWVLVLVIAVVGYDPNWVHPTLAAVLSALSFLFCQGVLIFRLVRKNYRSFWVGIVRDGASPTRKLSIGNAFSVWFQFIWPQAAFLAAVYIFIFWMGPDPDASSVRSLNSASLLARILLVGPIAIRCVMYAKYPDFRLQAYRRNRWSDPRPAEPAPISGN